MSDSPPPPIPVPADCDASTAQAVHADLQARLAAAGAGMPLSVELTDARSTVFALQLAVSAATSLTARRAFAGYGPNARAALFPETPA